MISLELPNVFLRDLLRPRLKKPDQSPDKNKKWETYFPALRHFQKQFGHCRVPPGWKNNPGLSRWVKQVQRRYDELSPVQLKTLLVLGFPFLPKDRAWLENFLEYADFQKGKIKPSAPRVEGLKVWATHQRKLRARMPLVRRSLLFRISFVWDPLEALWLKSYEQLEMFQKRFGHVNVPDNWSENPSLGAWCVTQRMQKKKLLPSRRLLLDKLKFDWSPKDTKWENQFEELKTFRKRFGHCNVAFDWKENKGLGRWVLKQRQRHSQMVASRRLRLEQLGFEWKRVGESWKRNFAQLKAYHQKHGHCRVAYSENRDLAKWCKYLRTVWTRDDLPPEKRRALERMDFVGRVQEDLWDRRWTELKAYRTRFGNTEVPYKWAGNSDLGVWVFIQRDAKRRRKLSRERIRRLESLDFIWEPLERQWELAFRQLEAFHQKNGHTSVPKSGKHKSLASWVVLQRQIKNKGSLDPAKIRKLEKLGLDWNVFDNRWEHKFEALRKFQKKEGHCLVPVKSPLGSWVVSQRQAFKNGTMPAERRKRLEALGFCWDTHDAHWAAMYKKLGDFKKRNGHCRVTPANGGRLFALWVYRQRYRMLKGTIKKTELARLKALGLESHC